MHAAGKFFTRLRKYVGVHELMRSYTRVRPPAFVFVCLISARIGSREREMSVSDPFSPTEEFPWCWHH